MKNHLKGTVRCDCCQSLVLGGLGWTLGLVVKEKSAMKYNMKREQEKRAHRRETVKQVQHEEI